MNLYCLTCHTDLCSFVEGAEHLVEGHLVESYPQ